MSKCGSYLCVVLSVLGLARVGLAQSTTSDVFQASVSWATAVQDEVNGTPKVLHEQVTTKQVINIARGRNLDAAVPVNEVLAVTVNEEDGIDKLIVFDTNAVSNLVTISQIMTGEAVGDPKAATFVVVGSVETAGNSTNRFEDGWLAMSGTGKLARVIAGGETNYAPASVKASVTGVLELVLTMPDSDSGTNETEDVTALLTKGTLSATKKIGQLIE